MFATRHARAEQQLAAAGPAAPQRRRVSLELAARLCSMAKGNGANSIKCMQSAATCAPSIHDRAEQQAHYDVRHPAVHTPVEDCEEDGPLRSIVARELCVAAALALGAGPSKGVAVAGLVVPHGLRNAEEEDSDAHTGAEHHHEPRRRRQLCNAFDLLMRAQRRGSGVVKRAKWMRCLKVLRVGFDKLCQGASADSL